MELCHKFFNMLKHPKLQIPLGLVSSGFGSLVVSMLASGTQDRGFQPGRCRRIFRAKIPQHAFLRIGSKAVCPMSQIFGM
jgi:hypothetical protein